MSARSVDLAIAIADLISDTQFSMSCNVSRKAVPFVTPEQLKVAEVSVFTGTVAKAPVVRNEFLTTYKPVVAVQKKLPADEISRLEQSDALQELVEEIEELLADDANAVVGEEFEFVGFDEELDRDTYGVEALRNMGVFATAIVLEYQRR